MQKRFFTLLLVLIGLAGMKAQEVQLVTLQNAEGTRIFYGADAFKEAMEAADHGNTITLTAGSFNATDITKAVSIYGAGYEIKVDKEKLAEGEEPKYPTEILGDFNIALDSINEQPVKGLYIEGIYSNSTITVTKRLEAANFVKCRFGYFRFGNWYNGKHFTESKDCSFMHCRIQDRFLSGESESMTVINSIFNGILGNTGSSTIFIQNSVIMRLSESFVSGILKNNIIGCVSRQRYDDVWSDFTNQNLNANISVLHNLFGNSYALNNIITKEDNWIDPNWATLFEEEGMNQYSDTALYQLTDEAKTKYLGTDSKEIGLYGGNSPFNPILTIPRVVRKSIAAETVDGKLKVNIKVETGDNSL